MSDEEKRKEATKQTLAQLAELKSSDKLELAKVGEAVAKAQEIIDIYYLLNYISSTADPFSLNAMGVLQALRGKPFTIEELLELIEKRNPEHKNQAQVLAFNHFLENKEVKQWWRFLHKVLEKRND